jgi:hypothetical protein
MHQLVGEDVDEQYFAAAAEQYVAPEQENTYDRKTAGRYAGSSGLHGI